GLALGIGAAFCGLVSSEANVFRLSVTGGWLGLVLGGVGAYFAYHLTGLSGIAVFQLICGIILLICLIILSLRSARYNPRMDRRPFLVQTIAFLGWIGALLLLVWNLLALR